MKKLDKISSLIFEFQSIETEILNVQNIMKDIVTEDFIFNLRLKLDRANEEKKVEIKPELNGVNIMYIISGGTQDSSTIIKSPLKEKNTYDFSELSNQSIIRIMNIVLENLEEEKSKYKKELLKLGIKT
jgi:hypothetical protein